MIKSKKRTRTSLLKEITGLKAMVEDGENLYCNMADRMVNARKKFEQEIYNLKEEIYWLKMENQKDIFYKCVKDNPGISFNGVMETLKWDIVKAARTQHELDKEGLIDTVIFNAQPRNKNGTFAKRPTLGDSEIKIIR